MTINIIHFIKDDIWLLTEHEFPLLKATFIKSLKIVLLAIQDFMRDLCPLRASALTLYTLLAVVPVIAMLFGIAKGFGLEKMLEQQLLEQIPHQDTTVLKLIGFARNLLEKTQGEVIAGIGVVVLLWSVTSMIGNIEDSFNHIWKISKGRPLSRKLSDYIAFMLLGLVLLILSSSITVFLKTKITGLSTVIALPEFGESLLLSALSLSPLLLMISLFSITFIFMPNHKVAAVPGIIAGVVTGVMYHVLQWLYLGLQIGVSSYNAIYGSLAALPLFVIWVQIGWMIVLFGCELAFYIQNYPSYRHNHNHTFSEFSFALKKIVALHVTYLIVKNFVNLGKTLTADAIALELLLSKAIVQSLLDFLVASHIVIRLKTEDGDDVYLPSVDTNKLTVAFVINALEQCGQNNVPNFKQDPVFVNMLNNFGQWLETSEQNRLLKDI
ncbi:MAG: YihY/virulence factor BrkB family protein [Methylobacter sp.]|uniref:YihY/virulence factor BrkB family protein n=1 Tax=Candidatus Methylobacter titanis TaxID=3053457 RepID=A0AA43TJM6_9GAMM|nr:YihY/virulence factor BrkB family protein [Candidatus Methylobacter titanis]MDI1292794.1 YihY/virulence factor BrkB family protein [Candidatus Methylobacter titanis]